VDHTKAELAVQLLQGLSQAVRALTKKQQPEAVAEAWGKGPLTIALLWEVPPRVVAAM
jgi:hypothetical protein